MATKVKDATTFRPWISGAAYDGSHTATEALISPWDGAHVADVVMADDAIVDAAVSSAQAAYLAHRLEPMVTRSQWLKAAADEADKVKDEIIETTVKALGKPRRAATFEVNRTISFMRMCAEEMLRQVGEVLPLDALPMGVGRFGFTRRMPYGVVAAFTPFNAPSNLLMQKVAPAIAMGNSVIVKPAFEGVGEALLLAESFTRAGVPDGMFNVIALHREHAAHLVGHRDVALVTLTGGTAAGNALASAAGAKPFIGELGGNSANIVCADADLADAAARISTSAFEASGQQCISAQRIIVEEPVLDAFVELFVTAAGKLKVGDPNLLEIDLGPMVNAAAADRVEAMVAEAVAGGATAALPLRREGAMIWPTIVVGGPSDARVVRDEVFGPVAVVIPAADVDDAIRIANDSEFGLQSSCFTSSLETAFRVSDELHVGSVWINEGSRFRMDTTPFGGVRSSGYGREGIKYALDGFSQWKFTGIRFPGRE